MSNFDRAVKALNDVDEAIDHLADNEAYVVALEAAGLLAPDLPELSQPLAEETYEYAVQFKNEESGKWYTSGFYGRGMHGQKWFASREEAEQQIERAYPADLVEPREHRILRRRVSPVEVVNDNRFTR